MCQRRNARWREQRQWLKKAPREETALCWRAEEKPCSVAQYLLIERFVLRWLDEFPGLRGDAMSILLTLSHPLLHQLYPGLPCPGTRLIDCPSFHLHELCSTAIDIALNYHLDPAFQLTQVQIVDATVGLTRGVDRVRVAFTCLLGDLQIDL